MKLQKEWFAPGVDGGCSYIAVFSFFTQYKMDLKGQCVAFRRIYQQQMEWHINVLHAEVSISRHLQPDL